MSESRYRAQAAHVRADLDLTGAPDEVVAMVAPLVAHATAHVAHVEGRDCGRTYTAPEPMARTAPGHVPVARTFGRGTEADDFETLDGAPVGRPESLHAAHAEASAARSDAYWTARVEERGRALTKSQRRRLRRAHKETAP